MSVRKAAAAEVDLLQYQTVKGSPDLERRAYGRRLPGQWFCNQVTAVGSRMASDTMSVYPLLGRGLLIRTLPSPSNRPAAYALSVPVNMISSLRLALGALLF